MTFECWSSNIVIDICNIYSDSKFSPDVEDFTPPWLSYSVSAANKQPCASENFPPYRL